MDAMLMMLAAFGGYIIMYRLYGRYIGKKIFALSGANKVPAVEMEDGVDYVPTKKEVIFGHHFTSIAGTGPIVGPAIAVIWGWAPAMIWIFVGSIMMGAVHDFGALILSMRNQGKSVSEITSKYINPRTKLFFFVVVFLDLLIITAIFGLVIAVIFNMFPASVLPVWLEVPIAMVLGYIIYKRGGNAMTWSIVALAVMYVTVVIGVYAPIKMPMIGSMPPTGTWTVLLLIYAFIASTLPVTALLQPRDFINSHQLLVALALMVIGVFAATFSGTQLHIIAPAVQAAPEGAPPMLPFLFITIACGAISGFHSLVSSGTTSKQVANEEDALFIGYGSMLTEATLSTLVIVAVAAGIGLGYHTADGATLTGLDAWSTHYSSWAAAQGLGSKVAAFVYGAANMIEAAGIPHSVALAIMGVFVASFAGTTMDTATRIERYALTELFSNTPIKIFNNKYVSTAAAVFLAGCLAFSSGGGGNGALALWPLFGCINQILAALVLTTVTVYLKGRGGLSWLIAGIPALFLGSMTVWAILINQGMYIDKGNILLQSLNLLVLAVSLWVVGEGLFKFFKTDGTTPVTDTP
ncbi:MULTISPECIES: carbon starvation protein A [unclassified Pseudodesulfovibrio]|uniref:carbon starvation CstA family protein n=1 Tax=unclassified Pseudodesulfovibrio TaxID=2661612 RepID=UPI000FEB6904|nr:MULTISPECIES: carbon starvation protein A [unclassified Pseudodesulfovibrio]MCJ2164814.1 carbon starvation protein A [Pseudodesulfovibrio sp. S3-i]RWU03815.1 carbon starvation protein A [Pseudodesulfovibrio sp. S3]